MGEFCFWIWGASTMKKASAGTSDERFKQQIEAQMHRLLQQLADLEEFKEDLDEDEYAETMEETKLQLRDFEEALTKITEGDVTLLDTVARMRLAVQAAIAEAFRTPEVAALFVKKQPGQLRTRLQNLDQSLKLRKITQSTYNDQRIEILLALQRLGEAISPEEEQALAAHTSKAMKDFAQASNEIGQGTRQGLVNLVGAQNTDAQNG